MKSKFTNLFLLFTFSVVVISGCGSPKEKKETAESSSDNMMKAAASSVSCDVCNENDDYKISLDSVICLIQAFDSAFITPRVVSNAGGVIDFDTTGFNVQASNDSSYVPFKLHWAFETIHNQTRLSITCELSPKNCTNNVYDGALGVEGPTLNATSAQNDFTLKHSFSDTLLKIDILRHLASKDVFAITKPGAVLIDSTKADSLLNQFKNSASSLSGAYPDCDDIVYNKKLTYDEIFTSTKKSALRYYFGYDTRAHIKHKLRLILIGIDKAGRLVIYDASDNLLIREMSRPRP